MTQPGARSKVLRPDELARTLRQGDVEPEPEPPSMFARAELPALIPGDVLSVKNDDSKPVEFAWNRRRWVVEPGATKSVPFEAIVNVLGDPRSDDRPAVYDDGNGNKGQVMRRGDELGHLFARYGIQFEDRKELTRAAPKLVVSHPETGYRINFPAFDPEMDAYPVLNVGERDVTGQRRALDGVMAENAQMRQELERMNGLISSLMEKQDQGLTGE